MALPVFEFPVEANNSGSKSFLTRTAQYGDGYAQVSSEGINSSKRTWSITTSGMLDVVQEVADFLDERSGYKSFAWKDPTGKLGLYRSASYELLPYSKDVFRLTTTFEEAFAP